MRNVYLAQVNHSFGDNVFLPYSVGMLQAYALTIPEIRDNYEFKGFIYLREKIEDVISRLEKPDVFGISVYIWNAAYSFALGKAVKEAFPNCLLVVGGPHIPIREEDFLQRNSWADVAVLHEGETAFAKILAERLYGVSHKGRVDLPRADNLESLPSPYLTGVFDNLPWEKYSFHPTQETHRGCPYSCTFCDWGSSVMTKVRRFSDERIEKEYLYFAERKVDLLVNADANYGMFERDVELTRKMVEIKNRTGYPKKFRASYAKNSGERVYQISKMLNDAGMSKGATLSFQSMDETTLETVKRKNIGIDTFSTLMKRYRKENIPTYSEIIIGLPGETYDSFANGLDKLVEAGQHDSTHVYICEVLPNSELNDPEYKKKHGIKVVECPTITYHASPAEDLHQETYHWIIGTNTLPTTDWLKCCMLSWAFQCFHCLGLTQKIAVFLRHYKSISYREFYEKLLDYASRSKSLLGEVYGEAENLFVDCSFGKSCGIVDQRFGNVVWPPEEGSFLKLISDKTRSVLSDLSIFVRRLIGSDQELVLGDILLYQKSVIKDPYTYTFENPIRLTLWSNIHEYIEACYMGEKTELKKVFSEYNLYVGGSQYNGDLEGYAKEVVWYGRKGGTGVFHRVEVVS